MKNKFLLLILIFPLVAAHATGALSAQVGGIHSLTKGENHSPNLDFMGSYYYAWDQMVFMGLGGGYQQFGEEKSFPATSSLFIRLPIGSVILPIAIGEWGYSFGAANQFLWRVSGGFDLKLGDSSSILGHCGMQNYFDSSTKSQLFWRTGLLLEF